MPSVSSIRTDGRVDVPRHSQKVGRRQSLVEQSSRPGNDDQRVWRLLRVRLSTIGARMETRRHCGRSGGRTRHGCPRPRHPTAVATRVLGLEARLRTKKDYVGVDSVHIQRAVSLAQLISGVAGAAAAHFLTRPVNFRVWDGTLRRSAKHLRFYTAATSVHFIFV